MSIRIASLLVLSLLAACASDTPTDGSSGDGSGSNTTEPGGPRFLTFGTDRTSIAATLGTRDIDDERLVISAVLTDPDGVEDIVGGTLYIDGTSTTLGTFATSAQEGAYTMSVTWAQLAAPLETQADWGTELAISLRAEFFDQAGHAASKTIPFTLACESTDPLIWTKVARTGCVRGPECSTGDSSIWCRSNAATMSGDEICSEVAGQQCLQCYNASNNELSCGDTTPNRKCQCQ